MQWCSLEPAKRIGLCRPIQIPERCRVPLGLVLCPFVVLVRIDGTELLRSVRGRNDKPCEARELES